MQAKPNRDYLVHVPAIRHQALSADMEPVSSVMTRLRVAGSSDDSQEEEVAPVCEEKPYPLYEPGRYEAQCTHACIYRDPQFRSWKALLRFRLVPSGDEVCGFFHLGEGDRPDAGPRSKYRRAWVIAND